MFNKYLLVSTLVCGLMSVSMGQDHENYMKQQGQNEAYQQKHPNLY